MTTICIGGYCIPISLFWPFLLLLIKPILEWYNRWTGKPNKNDGQSSASSSEDITLGSEIILKNETSFDHILHSQHHVIVRFTAPWCKPCKSIEPLYQELAKERPDVAFVTIDVDRFDSIAAKYKAFKIPLFLSFLDGEQAGKLVGKDDDKLKEFIQNLN